MTDIPMYTIVGLGKTDQTRILLVVSGCKGLDNTLQRAALSGYRKGFRVFIYELKQFSNTQELETVVQHLSKTYNGANLYAMGVEYGANLLVKHAGQSNTQYYKGIVSIGNPLLLQQAEKGFRGLWRYTLQKHMIEYRKKKAKITETVKNLYDIDSFEYNLKPDQVTQFKQKNSSINSIKNLQMRSLFINSLTDPFSIKKLSEDQRIQNPKCLFVQTHQGGHEEWFQSGKTTRWVFKAAVQFLMKLDDTKPK